MFWYMIESLRCDIYLFFVIVLLSLCIFCFTSYTNQSTNQSINQSINQSCWLTVPYCQKQIIIPPPCSTWKWIWEYYWELGWFPLFVHSLSAGLPLFWEENLRRQVSDSTVRHFLPIRSFWIAHTGYWMKVDWARGVIRTGFHPWLLVEPFTRLPSLLELSDKALGSGCRSA